jgi:hypothetical protein
MNMEATELPATELPLWLRKGARKVTILGPALGIAMGAGVVGLFTGHLPPATFESYMVGVLTWGGGIFAGANVLEHLAKAWTARTAR